MASLIRRALVVAPTFCRSLSRTTTPIVAKQERCVKMKENPVLHRCFSSTKPKLAKETVTITFVMGDNERHEVKCKLGDNLLDIVVEQDIDIDGFGACEGTLACSTCHLIFKPEHYEQIPEKPTDEELDMLDLAFGLTDTSRLGCQVIVTKDMDGWEVKVPEGVADAREP